MGSSPFRSTFRELGQERLGPALSNAYDAAIRVGDAELAKWTRLESEGYWASNPAMGEHVIVPAYRTVVGQHYDMYGRVFLVPDNLPFVNEDRLRFGVSELEKLSSTRDVIRVQNRSTASIIREHLNVEVHEFRFSAVAVSSVLTSIRMELIRRVRAAEPELEEESRVATHDDIVVLQPNISGIGFDLRAAWRRLRRN